MQSFFKVSVLVIFFLGPTFTASFAQIPWTKDTNNPVMSGGVSGTWNRHVFIPMVLYNPDSTRYEMWFCASIGPPNWDPYRIGFATSNDGINWTKIDTAVLKPDAGNWDESVAWAFVIRENGQYKMWYTGWTPTSPDGIGYATSPDGITWTKYPGNPVMEASPNDWEAGGPAFCSVTPVQGGGYEMWYTGSNANWTKSQIGYATSSDGITWTKTDSVNPVLTTGSPGQWDDAQILGSQVLFINNVYHMWYSGIRASDNPRQTGWATSIDGIHWNKYNDPNTTSTLYSDSDPVLKPSSGQWDGNFAQSVTVMLEGDSLRMWYQGSRSPTGTYLWRIGHATAPWDGITRLFEVSDIVLPGHYVLRQNYPNPFNPSTTIEFSLPKSEFIELKVFNILGKEVTTLVSNKLNSGNHTYKFDGKNLASGIYYYQLVAGDFREVKKMIILR